MIISHTVLDHPYFISIPPVTVYSTFIINEKWSRWPILIPTVLIGWFWQGEDYEGIRWIYWPNERDWIFIYSHGVQWKTMIVVSSDQSSLHHSIIIALKRKFDNRFQNILTINPWEFAAINDQFTYLISILSYVHEFIFYYNCKSNQCNLNLVVNQRFTMTCEWEWLIQPIKQYE